jgi:hypothetical protein
MFTPIRAPRLARNCEGEGGAGGGHASAKVVETMRLRIEMAQGGVEFVCRKATALIVVSAAMGLAVMMRVEASEVGLTQSEHLSVTVSKL